MTVEGMTAYLRNASILENALYKIGKREQELRGYLVGIPQYKKVDVMREVKNTKADLIFKPFQVGVVGIIVTFVLHVLTYIIAAIVAIIMQIGGNDSRPMGEAVSKVMWVLDYPSNFICNLLFPSTKKYVITDVVLETVSYYFRVPLTWGIVFVVIGFIFYAVRLVKNIKGIEGRKEYAQNDYKMYLQDVQKRNKNNDDINRQLALLGNEKRKVTECLRRLYNENVLSPEFRNREAVTLMFGYLFYKEVSTWENCVATYRNDRNTRMIINKMDEIIYGLERIEIAMLRGFDNISRGMDNISRGISSLTEVEYENNRLLQNISESEKKIAHNSDVSLVLNSIQVLQLDKLINY